MASQTELPTRHPSHWHPDSSQLLPVQVRRDGGVATVSAHGEVDLVTHETLSKAVDKVFQSCPNALVLDLTAVTFCACAGLSVLLGTAERARSSGTPLRLACDGRAILRPLQLAGLADQFQIWPTVGHAIADAAKAV